MALDQKKSPQEIIERKREDAAQETATQPLWRRLLKPIEDMFVPAQPASGAATADQASASGSAGQAFSLPCVIRCEAGEVFAPVKGTVVRQEEIPDATFASGVLGAGVGIQPDDETILSPMEGTISFVAPSKHTIGIVGPGGMDVLIHVGIDTVTMNGDGFTPLIKEDDAVKRGQPILKFSKEKIQAAAYSDIVVVLLTNSDDYQDVEIEV